MSQLSISPGQRFKKSDDNLISDMDGEKVMLSIRSGKYYNLGQTGGRIWELVEPSTTFEELVNQLTKEYEIDREMCEQHVSLFLQQLIHEELIEPVHDPVTSGSDQ